MIRARLRSYVDPSLQVHSALHQPLLQTDLGAKLAVGLFQLP
jgi:hypothetical protein